MPEPKNALEISAEPLPSETPEAGGNTLSDPSQNALNDTSGGLSAPTPDFIGKISDTQITEVINRGIAYAIIIAGLLSVAYLLYGGISFILSAGQEDKVKQATATIRHSIIGLIVTVLAVVAVATVGRAMGVNIIQYINFSEIIDIIQGVGTKMGLS